jgi:hypothetical protein
MKPGSYPPTHPRAPAGVGGPAAVYSDRHKNSAASLFLLMIWKFLLAPWGLQGEARGQSTSGPERAEARGVGGRAILGQEGAEPPM